MGQAVLTFDTPPCWTGGDRGSQSPLHNCPHLSATPSLHVLQPGTLRSALTVALCTHKNLSSSNWVVHAMPHAFSSQFYADYTLKICFPFSSGCNASGC